jgi:hypothetical protein
MYFFKNLNKSRDKFSDLKMILNQVQWRLTSIISATCEAEIGVFHFKASQGKKVSKARAGHSGSCYNPSYMGGGGRELTVQGGQGKKHKTLSEK